MAFDPSQPYGTVNDTSPQVYVQGGLYYLWGGTQIPDPAPYVKTSQGSNPITVPSRLFRISTLGDSTSAILCTPSAAPYSNGTPPIPSNYSTYWNISNRGFGPGNYVMHAGMRSGGRVFCDEFCYNVGGFNSANAVQYTLPWMQATGQLFHFPDAAVINLGINDINGGLTIAQSKANWIALITGLQAMGVMPILSTCFPGNTNYLIRELNDMIQKLAQTYRIPCADFYGALVDVSTGSYATGLQIGDNTHPTPLAGALCGYQLYQALNQWGLLDGLFVSPTIDNASLTYQSRHPNFDLVSGTINTSSSYPTDWGAPNNPTMSTLFNSSGTEPGSLHTQFASPAVVGQAARYAGNSWSFLADGVNASCVALPAIGLSGISLGQRISLAFQIRFSVATPTNLAGVASQVACLLKNSGTGTTCGLDQMGDFGVTYGASTPIGNETGYPVGYFYCEYTCNVVVPDTKGYSLGAYGAPGYGTPPAGDSCQIANFRIANLSAAGLVPP